MTASASAETASSASTGAGGGPSGTGRATGILAGHGCPAGGPGVPAGAGSVLTTDLDGDHRPDRLWLADIGTARTLGIRTASGAGFTLTFSDAAPTAAVAMANTLHNGAPIILLDPGRQVRLYAVAGCHIVPTLNPQGQQYTFDKGFIGTGTGVGCPNLPPGGPHLVGYNAVPSSPGTLRVLRTTITVGADGRHAANGVPVTLGTNLPQDSPVVRTAYQVACGNAAQAHEPQS